MNGHLIRLTVVVAGALIAVCGCTRGPVASAAPATIAPATIAPVESASSAALVPSDPSDCLTLFLTIDSVDPTLDNLRAERGDVVIGTVTSIGKPFWDSPTGQRPKPGEQMGPGNEFAILTPYTVTVGQSVKGAGAPGEVTVVVEGGQIGCDRFEVDPSITLEVKGDYALFMAARPAANGAGTMKLPMVYHAFPVQADGKVMTPLDGAVSVDALSSALMSGVQSPTP